MDTTKSTILLHNSQNTATYGDPPLAIIICDDPLAALGKLTAERCKAALPFAGKYRLIDLALSNCVNSEIDTVGVITQYKPRSLDAHVAYGRPWDLDRRQGGLTLLHPYQAQAGIDWYTGSANALYQNRDFIRRQRPAHVLVLAESQAYGMDFAPLIAQHCRTKADVTIVAAVGTDDEPVQSYHTLKADSDGRVLEVIPPGSGDAAALVVMGLFLFSSDSMDRSLEQDATRHDSTHDLIVDLLPQMIEAGSRVMVYQHTGYWNGIRTVYDYWQAGMDLVAENPRMNLQDASWPIRTNFEVRPPTRVSSGARITHSLISEGCILDGTVEYSILSPGVCVAPGAVVRNAIVMHNTSIEEQALVEHAIVDMDVIVGPHAHVGRSSRRAPTVHSAEPVQLTIIEKGAHVPARETVVPDLTEQDWLFSRRREVSSRSVDVA